MFCYYSVFGHESQDHCSPLGPLSSRMPLPFFPVLICFVGFVGVRHSVCVCVYVCMYACMYVCMYVYIYVYAVVVVVFAV